MHFRKYAKYTSATLDRFTKVLEIHFFHIALHLMDCDDYFPCLDLYTIGIPQRYCRFGSRPSQTSNTAIK